MTELALIAVTVIGVVAPFLGIICWQIFAERKNTREIDYKKWHTKQIIKNPMLRVPSKQVSKMIQPESDTPSLLGLLKGMDIDTVKQFMGALQKDGDFDPEQITGGGGILDSIMNYAQENPEVVMKLAEKFTSGAAKKEEINFL